MPTTKPTLEDEAREWLVRMEHFGDSDVQSLVALLREHRARALEEVLKIARTAYFHEEIPQSLLEIIGRRAASERQGGE